VVALQIFDSILQLSIFSLMQIFHDVRAGCFCPGKVAFDIFDKYRQALRSVALQGGAGTSRTQEIDHDPGVAQVQLRALHWIAIVVMLDEAESRIQPLDGASQILVGEMGQHDVCRHRAISQHGLKILPAVAVR
jgi:hypothetical protein